jgi:predicted RNA-binding Zn-ribbon protein involved in translation (DUF1610 family)
MKRRDRHSGDLYLDPSGQTRLTGKSAEQLAMEKKTVECLGQAFKSDEARRAYFLEKLREKLTDPEFKKTPGFPTGTDEDILRLSDPPYYTACPNPFVKDFVRVHGKPYDPQERYEREPFAVDVSEGKTDQLYKAHGYHTKVPHLAIVPSILHYTKPGDVVLDGFCGSGMTGVAAQWCGTAPGAYRRNIEERWKNEGLGKPDWGGRKVILGDLGPAATFIASNYNTPFDVHAFATAAQRILDEVENELGWMYETTHTDGRTKGRINFTVWSEVFSCPECGGDVNFVEVALNEETKRIDKSVKCPHCGAASSKECMDLQFETFHDASQHRIERRPKRIAVIINYTVGDKRFEKRPDASDVELLERIAGLALPQEIPTCELPDCQMTRVGRMRTTNTRHVHHLFLPRAAQALAALWRRANAEQNARTRNMLLFFAEQAIWGLSVLARYAPTHFSQVNQYLNGVYYVGSQIAECGPWYILDGKLDRLAKAFTPMPSAVETSIITTGDCASIPIAANSVDYVFTDPPFGENIYYADLNFLVESWHRVLTNPANEAIVDRAKKKGVHEYQELMRRCFEEYHRVLKPGRWMTVVFSNSSNGIWRAIQEAMGTAGFVVADVRTLDKKQGSYRQVTSTAVKQDLVISAYKPTEALTERFRLGSATPEGTWAFVAEHLRHVPVFVGRNGQAEVVIERTAQMLHDRVIAFHVQRSLAIPLSTGEFLAGLMQRYPDRDGMYFLSDQVAEYDRKRTTVDGLRQLNLFVSDEASATLWVRQQLQSKPQTFQELQPQLMHQLQTWAKHEKTIELKEILALNFLRYDGHGHVPNQIHSYLSTNFKDLRNLSKDDPTLRAKAEDRWYVPDPSKEGDLEKLRLRTMLKEFEDYKASTSRKLKQFRTEAVRAGFKRCYDNQDYQTIVAVAAKLPEAVLQEDEKLLMYYDVASMRLGEET